MKNGRKARAGILFIRWLVVPLLVLSLGLLIVSNLVLQTSAVRNWVERKLERRSGFEWSIGSLSWTPWTGIRVRDLKAELRDQGSGATSRSICQADVDVHIYWGTLLTGVVGLREVRLRQGAIAIPVELLSLLPEEGASGQKPAPAQSLKPEGEQRNPGSKPGKADPEIPPAGGRRNQRPAADRPFKMIIDRCDVVLYSGKGQDGSGFILQNLRGELPLQGEDVTGWIECDGLTLGDRTVVGPWRSQVEWRRPLLLLPPTDLACGGLSVRCTGSIRMRGAPRFLMNVEVPAGPVRMSGPPMGSWSGIEVDSELVHMQGSLTGTLTSLASWRGDLKVKASRPGLTHPGRGDKIEFERGSLTASLRSGTLQVIDTRLQSEHLSFLGNGVLVPDGRVRGVLRVVADQDHAAVIKRFAVGSMLTGGWTRSWLEPLETPDRYYRDIQLWGTLDRAVVDVGREGEELEVSQVWKQMVEFLKNEIEETGQGMTPSR